MSRTSRIFPLLPLVASLLSLASGPASALSLLGDERTVKAAYYYDCGLDICLDVDETLPVAPFAAFDAAAVSGSATAQQTSSVGTTSMTGDGSAALPGSYDAYSRSTFRVEFAVGLPTTIVLDGLLTTLDHDYGSTEASYSLGPSGGTPLFESFLEGPGDGVVHEVPFHVDTVLDPGTYVLEVFAFADYSYGEATYHFDLSVPEPGTGLLLTLGLAALLVPRRPLRRRH